MTDSNLVYSSETGVADATFLASQDEGAWSVCGEDGCTGLMIMDGPRAVVAYCNTCGAGTQVHCCEECAYGPEDGVEKPAPVDPEAFAAAMAEWEASFPRTEWDERMERILGDFED